MHFFENLQFRFDIYPHLSGVVWMLILLALAFDFLNGLHDAANSVATVVSTRVLTPRMAVLWAAFFNFVAFLVFPTKVATTIQSDVINPDIVTSQLIAATLMASCGWNILTWYLGLPTSSSHALIGGMVGAALASTGSLSNLRWDGLSLIVAFIVLAPLIGLILGMAIAVAVTWLCYRQTPRRVDGWFRKGQLVSAGLFSLGHGGNDAQKTMGIIFVLLTAVSHQSAVSAGHGPLSGEGAAVALAEGKPLFRPPDRVPTEVVLACHLAMGLGTLFGGWRIVKTMGQRIIHLRPIDGFCAETAAATVLGLTTFYKGIPISTTHTITGSIVGVGSLKRLSAVRWGVAGRVVWAWVLTIPGAGLVAALSWWGLHLLGRLF